MSARESTGTGRTYVSGKQTDQVPGNGIQIYRTHAPLSIPRNNKHRELLCQSPLLATDGGRALWLFPTEPSVLCNEGISSPVSNTCSLRSYENIYLLNISIEDCNNFGNSCEESKARVLHNYRKNGSRLEGNLQNLPTVMYGSECWIFFDKHVSRTEVSRVNNGISKARSY